METGIIGLGAIGVLAGYFVVSYGRVEWRFFKR
jgi:ketopantoate reductase